MITLVIAPEYLEMFYAFLMFGLGGLLIAWATPPRKVDQADTTQALATVGDQARYNQLRDRIMTITECTKQTAELAIAEACRQGCIVQANGHYRLALEFASETRPTTDCPHGVVLVQMPKADAIG